MAKTAKVRLATQLCFVCALCTWRVVDYDFHIQRFDWPNHDFYTHRVSNELNNQHLGVRWHGGYEWEDPQSPEDM